MPITFRNKAILLKVTRLSGKLASSMICHFYSVLQFKRDPYPNAGDKPYWKCRLPPASCPALRPAVMATAPQIARGRYVPSLGKKSNSPCFDSGQERWATMSWIIYTVKRKCAMSWEVSQTARIRLWLQHVVATTGRKWCSPLVAVRWWFSSYPGRCWPDSHHFYWNMKVRFV